MATIGRGGGESSSSSSPPPPSSLPRFSYQVFLSFRGADTRKKFTDHLYKALVDARYATFRDDDEIERGKNIQSELEKAIRESRVFIVVFSESYATSRWCLDQLVMILDRSRTSTSTSTSGVKVLPLFYDVEPTEVRNQIGSFKEAFVEYEKRIEGETCERKKDELKEKVGKWKAALREAADLAGMNLGDK